MLLEEEEVNECQHQQNDKQETRYGRTHTHSQEPKDMLIEVEDYQVGSIPGAPTGHNIYLIY